MIIFNLWAIPVALVIFLVVAGLNHFFPVLANDHYFSFTAGTTIFVIGGIAEWFGVKARVFFLPIWLIGIGFICAKLGPIGWVLLGLIAVGCVIFMIRWVKKSSTEEWRKAQEEIAKSPNPPVLKELEFWNWVQTTLYFPLSSLTPEQCAHDLKVLQGIRNAQPRLTPPDAAGFAALEQFLDKNKNEPKCPPVENKLQEKVLEVIGQKIKKAKPETPFQALGNPLPEAVPNR